MMNNDFNDKKLDFEDTTWLVILLIGAGIITTDNPEIKKKLMILEKG